MNTLPSPEKFYSYKVKIHVHVDLIYFTSHLFNSFLEPIWQWISMYSITKSLVLKESPKSLKQPIKGVFENVQLSHCKELSGAFGLSDLGDFKRSEMGRLNCISPHVLVYKIAISSYLFILTDNHIYSKKKKNDLLPPLEIKDWLIKICYWN